jgi:GT2 family glycosyltransferase
VCARNFPTVSSYFFQDIQLAEAFPRNRLFGQWNMEYWDHLDSRDVPCICGASMMIPRRVLDQVGGLDESHFMYFEDIEFCHRLGQAGLAIHYLAEAEVVHLGGQSSSQVLAGTAVLSLESVADFMGIVYGPAHRLGLRAAIFASATVRLAAILLGVAAKHILGINKKWFNRSWMRREFARFKWSLGFLSISR